MLGPGKESRLSHTLKIYRKNYLQHIQTTKQEQPIKDEYTSP